MPVDKRTFEIVSPRLQCRLPMFLIGVDGDGDGGGVRGKGIEVKQTGKVQ